MALDPTLTSMQKIFLFGDKDLWDPDDLSVLPEMLSPTSSRLWPAITTSYDSEDSSKQPAWKSKCYFTIHHDNFRGTTTSRASPSSAFDSKH